MITLDQLKDIKERTEALNRYLAIEDKLIQVEEEQLRTQVPGFWDDAKKAEAQMKKVKDLQSWIDGYKQVKSLADEVEKLGEKAGRRVTLGAVTKSGSDDELIALAKAGIGDSGENRPSELKRRGELLAQRGLRPRLHEIGNLQRNKVKLIIDTVDLSYSEHIFITSSPSLRCRL